MDKTYRVSGAALAFNYVAHAIIVVVAILILFLVALNPSQDEQVFAAIYSGAVLLIMIPDALLKIRTITLTSDGTLRFKSLITEKGYPISNLYKIRTSFFSGYIITFDFRKSSISAINSIEHLDDLITTIKTINTSVAMNVPFTWQL